MNLPDAAHVVVDAGPSRDPVSEARIRLWCDALEDRNPVYVDPDAAAASRFGHLVAPPAMLETWVMPPLTHADPRVRAPEARDEYGDVRELRSAGYTAAVSTDSQQRYRRYLEPGDRLSKRSWVVEVSELKHTRLGRGHFVTIDVEYRDQDDAVVGEHRMRHYFFTPAPATVRATAASPPALPERPPATPYASVIGAALPELVIPLTPTRVIASAFAAGDHYRAHHDRHFAIANGMRDVFMSILATNGLVGRYVTDWSGPDSAVESIVLRLGAPAYAGDVLSVRGCVADAVTTGGDHRVTLEVTAGLDGPAPHAVATVTATVPAARDGAA